MEEPFEAWVAGYLDPVGGAQDAYWKEAVEAVLQTGTNGIPVLLRMLQNHTINCPRFGITRCGLLLSARRNF